MGAHVNFVIELVEKQSDRQTTGSQDVCDSWLLAAQTCTTDQIVYSVAVF